MRGPPCIDMGRCEACHALTWVDVRPALQDRNSVALPLATLDGQSASLRTLRVLKRFEFDPALTRSGVIARDKSVNGALLFVRGAPHKVVGLVKGGALPSDFDQVVLEYAGQSFRLLALAAGTLRRVTAERLASMSQQEAEAECGHMDLLALIVLSNSAHSASRPAITSLQERGGIRTMMITGDYQHTAIAVARGVGMIAMDSQVVIMEAESERAGSASASAPVAQYTPPLPKPGSALQHPGQKTVSSSCQHLMFTLDRGGVCEEVDPHTAITSIAQGSMRCCVTGPALQHILQKADAPLVEAVMRSLVVCARMRSHQKAQVMDLLGRTGLYLSPDSGNKHAQPHYMPGLGVRCMYCGDGINDLAALASAEAGMAVGAGHASAAACLADSHPSIQGVVPMLREARATQAVKMAAIKYMVVYELFISVAVNVLWSVKGIRFSVPQRSMIDVIAITMGIVATFKPAAEELTKERPPQQLSRHQNRALVVVGVVVVSAMFWATTSFLKHQAWFSESTGDTADEIAATVIWLVALNSAALPMATSANDTRIFCSKYSKLELILILANTTFGVLCSLLGPSWFDALNVFHFHHLPWAFLWRLYLLICTFLVLYVIALQSVKKVFDWCERHLQNRVLPV
ncbi:TPA: hypothetical protein ACH3X2_001258 [Trebouxia sp. C0005]